MREQLFEVLRLMSIAANYRDPNPTRSHITGQEHALRVAGMAARADPSNKHDLAFVGLVHDLARPLNEFYHGEIIAEIVRDAVCEDAYHVLRTHGAYQEMLMRNAELPRGDEAWRPLAKMFAELEESSFSRIYHGPQLTPEQGTSMLRRYLDYKSLPSPDASVN